MSNCIKEKDKYNEYLKEEKSIQIKSAKNSCRESKVLGITIPMRFGLSASYRQKNRVPCLLILILGPDFFAFESTVLRT